ncbi:hypothetical protein HET73_05925 [Wolbachia endosymbiont of Atemnus politus]|nr:hypothetical protein [Wolbachia endosymbiont of Atemnus politus]NSM56890.1 hypothetical protein [Wolbachia endosymbiont of Atemnus politus]
MDDTLNLVITARDAGNQIIQMNVVKQLSKYNFLIKRTGSQCHALG